MAPSSLQCRDRLGDRCGQNQAVGASLVKTAVAVVRFGVFPTLFELRWKGCGLHK